MGEIEGIICGTGRRGRKKWALSTHPPAPGTILVLNNDLYEGGDAKETLKRMTNIVNSGVQGVSSEQLKPALDKMLSAYLANRVGFESFSQFTARHEVGALQSLFS